MGCPSPGAPFSFLELAMKLGKYFTLDEMTVSQAAARHGIRNAPGAAATNALRDLVLHILDPLREHYGRPVIVSSGFRNDRVNKLVGGSSTSQHRFGEAADITIPGVPVADVVATIKRLCLPYDQLIDEFGNTPNGWTHVSYGPRHRRQHLLARKRYGKTVYTSAPANPPGR